MRDDCDGDAILLSRATGGPACHTGAESCFAPWLWRVVAERAATRPEGSYVARCSTTPALAAHGRSARKGSRRRSPRVGESDERLVEELADLWFHSYVLLAARGLEPRAGRGGAGPPSRPPLLENLSAALIVLLGRPA